MSSGSGSLAGGGSLASFREKLAVRCRLLNGIRKYFLSLDYLEVETPIRIPAPALELHIHAIPSAGLFLRTSPELHMKRLLAAGYERIFQVGACFRKGESGRLHNPEYTMLEWYRAGVDYEATLQEAEQLLLSLCLDLNGADHVDYLGQRICFQRPWRRVSVAEAFIAHAGWDPVEHFDPDRFDVDLVERVEPALPLGVPTVLIDYPAGAGGLARRKPSDPRVVERWELYLGGIEIANAFSELTDPVEQRSRFEQVAKAMREGGAEAYPIDELFLSALESGMPESSGVALGVDRLAMIFGNCASIDEVLPFRTEIQG